LAFESERIRERHHYSKLELEGWTYGMKANGAAIEVERHEDSALGRRAQALSAPPMLVTIVSYLGAVCIGAWASLNLLHWFWRQLQ